MSSTDSRERFTERVQDYVRARPSYPAELLSALDRLTGGLRDLEVADVGAGTGLFSELLLEQGARVHAVEPNEAMLDAAIERLGRSPGFTPMTGQAEDTGLATASIDLVTSAQAFHWFDPPNARREFARILRDNGLVALIWNHRRLDSEFGEAYDEFQREFGGEEHLAVEARRARAFASFPVFFGPEGFQRLVFQQFQQLDREGFAARFFSMSSAPKVEDVAGRLIARRRLDELFDRFAVDGQVRIDYDCLLFVGRLSGDFLD